MITSLIDRLKSKTMKKIKKLNESSMGNRRKKGIDKRFHHFLFQLKPLKNGETGIFEIFFE
jgi:hypothetical protein